MTARDAARWARATVYDLQVERQAELGYLSGLRRAGADLLAVQACQERIQRLEALILDRGHMVGPADG